MADLLNLETREVAEKVLIASISTLAETKDEAGLQALAQSMELDTKTMVHDYGHYAVAKFMFSGELHFDPLRD